MAATISRKVNTPLVFMGYYNPILSYGLDRFCRDSASAGINGLIIPDLPPDESAELDISRKLKSRFDLPAGAYHYIRPDRLGGAKISMLCLPDFSGRGYRRSRYDAN